MSSPWDDLSLFGIAHRRLGDPKAEAISADIDDVLLGSATANREKPELLGTNK